MGTMLSLLLPTFRLEDIDEEGSMESPIGRNSEEELKNDFIQNFIFNLIGMEIVFKIYSTIFNMTILNRLHTLMLQP